mmetsp:Transcript_42554/g.76297  ORF Transcript_42554/g.76297 Transcript_42554/m.76297 type:complete len:303 (-) Transcript_42554:1643-2551(-)|eukprot:CAMPEP_0177762550 /NCGR_PEP_ID=MMETSP0491_2-20121128/6406_1 /TAXON_ID=63592 /ORGANISM="Tetraselmis chuii, Strain PLY429" /LENGTH=302 /DNA_ID=CAMNT_0019278615 /DNA_START=1168 /DNA_END=2076 /DNA_ORIENTATION=+
MASMLSAVIRASRPKFRDGCDRVAFAAHAFLLGKSLKLVAVGKAADEAAGSSDALREMEEVGIEGWADLPDMYAFFYLPEAEGKPVLLKCLRAGGNKLLLQAAALGSTDEPQVAEVEVEKYTIDSADLMNGYSDLEGLATLLDKSIKLQSFETKPHAVSQPSAPKNDDQAQQRNDPGMDDPLRDGPPRFGRGVGFMPPRMPGMGVGTGDMMPGGFVAPGGGFGGGMHMGPMDPNFSGSLRHPHEIGQGSVPAGARYDPIGPPGMRGYNPEDFQRGRGRGFGVHPDLGPPPGMGSSDWDDMFG